MPNTGGSQLMGLALIRNPTPKRKETLLQITFPPEVINQVSAV